MNMEDLQKALEALGKGGLNFAGDFVLEKHVENEIGNVEKGGIGIQINNYDTGKSAGNGSDDVAEKPKGGRPKRAGKPINKAFVYDAGNETNIRLQLFFNGLKALRWIREDTDMRSLHRIFSGGETTTRIVWTGDINALAFLFKELVNVKKLIQLPEGESIWVMVNARFWEWEGNREFGNERLGSTRTPIEQKDNIDLLVDIMTPSIPIEEIKERMQSQQ